MKKIIVLSIFLLISFNMISQWKSPLSGAIMGLSLSPSGETLVFASPTWRLPFYTLFLADIKTGKTKELLKQESMIFFPQFSQNGKRIFFLQSGADIVSSFIVSCDLNGKDLRIYGDAIKNHLVSNSSRTRNGQFVYLALDSIGEISGPDRLYKMNLKNGKVSQIQGIEASDISGLSICGNDILFSKVQKYGDDSVVAKLFRLMPDKGDAIEEIVPQGELKQFMWPKYHKKTDQLILCRQSKFYKMDMKTKEVSLFCDLKDRRFMCYDISQKEELLYFFEIGGRKITVIDFEGNEIKSIPLE